MTKLSLARTERVRLGRNAGAATGALLAAAGLELFLIPHGMTAGGAIGVSALIAFLADARLGLLLLLLHAVFLLVGYRRIVGLFGHSAVIGLSVLSLGTLVLHPLPALTGDPLLAALMGGALLGAGSGVALRIGGFTDVSHFVKIRWSTPAISRAFHGLNAALFLGIGLAYGWERALYSLLAFALAAEATRLMLRGYPFWKLMWIWSEREDDVRAALASEGKREFVETVGEEASPGGTRPVLLCRVHRLEEERLRRLVREADPDARLALSPVGEDGRIPFTR